MDLRVASEINYYSGNGFAANGDSRHFRLAMAVGVVIQEEESA